MSTVSVEVDRSTGQVFAYEVGGSETAILHA